MEITVVRKWFTEKSTIGEMSINGQFFCYTLEDKMRPEGVKIPKETAIPMGRYEIMLGYSDRFQRLVPRVLNVPMFTGILVHSGNSAVDTEGCLLVGMTKENDNFIGKSRVAFDALMQKLQRAIKVEKVFITITAAEALPAQN
jgi:hypothetical protein